MEINLNETTVRAMANRLRAHLKASASVECSLSQSLESTAKMLGHKNWDTLIGILRKENAPSDELERRRREWASRGWREKPPKVAKPFVFMWEAFACYALSEWGSGPQWARIVVTQDLVNDVHRLQTECLENALTRVERTYTCEEWQYAQELCIGGGSLVVDPYCFCMSAMSKYEDYAVETRTTDIKDFFDVIEQGERANSSDLAWAAGVLFKARRSAKNFALFLQDMGHLPEDFNEARIDEMP